MILSPYLLFQFQDPAISNTAKSYAPYEEGLNDDIFVKNDNGSVLVGKVVKNFYISF